MKNLHFISSIGQNERLPSSLADEDRNLSGLNSLFVGFDTSRGGGEGIADKVLAVSAIATLSLPLEAVTDL